MGCLTSAKFNMKATILHQTDMEGLPEYELPYGEWVDNQDPLTGQIIRVWRPVEVTPDDPDTDEDETIVQTVKCLARGVNYKSARDENFGDKVKYLDSVNLWVPASTLIDRRDRVTNIKDSRGNIIWISEYEGSPKRAMMFNVVGVSPILDFRGKHMETYAVLERSETP